MGYSMGGFGVYAVCSHTPNLFNVDMPIAGNGLSTLEPADRGHHAPQPEASRIFQVIWSAMRDV